MKFVWVYIPYATRFMGQNGMHPNEKCFYPSSTLTFLLRELCIAKATFIRMWRTPWHPSLNFSNQKKVIYAKGWSPGTPHNPACVVDMICKQYWRQTVNLFTFVSGHGDVYFVTHYSLHLYNQIPLNVHAQFFTCICHKWDLKCDLSVKWLFETGQIKTSRSSSLLHLFSLLSCVFLYRGGGSCKSWETRRSPFWHLQIGATSSW